MPAAMAIPKNISFVTFDVYGTLIDWETGAYDAFKAEAERDGFTIERDELIPLFHEIQQQIQAGSYELYAEVLRRTAVQIAKQLGWPLEPSRSGFLPDSVQRWKPFKETNSVLAKIAKKYKIGLISNIDDKLLGQTRRHIPLDFDLVVTAQQVRSYKPDPAHFTECERRIGGKKGWVHVAASYYHDVEPCLKKKDPGDLGQPHQAAARAGPEEARRRGQHAARGGEADRHRRRAKSLRVLALHADVIVFISRVWQTTCTAVRAGDEGFVIDSPVYPDELEALAGVLEQAGFPVSGLLATHADWDHLLGPARVSRRVARAAARATARPARGRAGRGPARAARRSTRSTTSSGRRPLALGGLQALPVPGGSALGPSTRARAAPRRRPHRRRRRRSGSLARVSRVRRLPLAGRDPDDLAGRIGRPRTWRRWSGCGRPGAAGRDGRARPRRSARPRRGAARARGGAALPVGARRATAPAPSCPPDAGPRRSADPRGERRRRRG